jgi:hypothetical protein
MCSYSHILLKFEPCLFKDKPERVNMSKLFHYTYIPSSFLLRSQDSVVSVMARLWAVFSRNHGSIPNGSEEFIASSKCSDQLWGTLNHQ